MLWSVEVKSCRERNRHIRVSYHHLRCIMEMKKHHKRAQRKLPFLKLCSCMVAEHDDFPDSAKPYIKAEKLSTSSSPPSSSVVSGFYTEFILKLLKIGSGNFCLLLIAFVQTRLPPLGSDSLALPMAWIGPAQAQPLRSPLIRFFSGFPVKNAASAWLFTICLQNVL